ncbi:CU044_2847 family protein [Pseudonocardia tropica]|uniref:CU044_2847 family protein n=1 Tax=Pseudonocardia tropica TaxID=681289 RepID=A0ABV1K4N6_9PSEU
MRYELPDGGTVVVVVQQEAADADNLRLAARSDAVIEAQTDFESATAVVTPIAESLIGRMRGMSRKPDTVEVEFGLSLSMKMGAVIASSSMQANFKIKIVWNGHDE